MKNLLTVLAIFALFNSFGQVPQKMSYQTIVRNAQNQLIPNNAVGMRLSIIQNSPTGTVVYVETHTPITNGNGTVTIEVGAGIVVSGVFNTIDWSTGNYWLQTEIDPQGGQGYSITGVSQLLTVPFAFFCDDALNAGNGIDTAQVINDSLYVTTSSGITINAGSVAGSNNSHYVGEEFGGGIIFHLWKDGLGVEHGLVVDLYELSTSQAWSNVTNVLIGANAKTIDGFTNSNAIVNQAGHTNSAASLCLNSTNGGFSDWYLPSRDELKILFDRRFTMNTILTGIVGADLIPMGLDTPYPTYWSSTETGGGTQATFVDAFWVECTSASKSTLKMVRAIRQF